MNPYLESGVHSGPSSHMGMPYGPGSLTTGLGASFPQSAGYTGSHLGSVGTLQDPRPPVQDLTGPDPVKIEEKGETTASTQGIVISILIKVMF